MKSFEYDHSITVVRAISVIGIIVFHINKQWLPLGFLGVDLFFVISGFLITKIIQNEILSQSFSFKRFYSRRFMRLMPALYVTLSCSVAATYILDYHSVELRELLESSITALLFAANFYFWQNVGYFVTSTAIMENVHLWSLSVEEQFYVVWPVTFLIFSRFFRLTHWSFILLALVLTIFSLYLSSTYPRPAFYLLPTRAWQFLAGALFAVHLDYLKKKFMRMSKTVPLAGILACIVAGGTVYDGEHSIALYTIIITALLGIYFASGQTDRFFDLLSNRVVIWIGLASYSIYLCHQPILAITRKTMQHPEYQSLTISLLFIPVIFFFGAISFKIENLFRYKVKNLKYFVMLHLFLLCLAIYLLSSLPRQNINSPFADPAKFDYGCQSRNILGCNVKVGTSDYPTKLLLLGNSHARMLIPALKKRYDELELLHPDTLSRKILGPNDDIAIQTETTDADKLKWIEEICSLAEQHDTTLISYRYIGFIYKVSNAHLSETKFNDARYQILTDRIKTLAKCAPHLIIIGQVPELDYWPRNIHRQTWTGKAPFVERHMHDKITLPIENALTELAHRYPNVDYISPQELLCDDKVCFGTEAGSQFSNLPIYYDDDHLNIIGTSILIDQILEIMKGK